MNNIIKRFLALGLVVYCSICAALYVFQRDILYKPSGQYDSPETLGLDVDEIILRTEDGLELTTWYKPATPNKRTVVYFHGNAGNLSKRREFYHSILNAGYGLMALEYRGYSKNEGTPTEKGLYLDARAAIEWLKKRRTDESSMILIGRSLGTGVAMEMSTHYPNIFATALISPYSSIADIAKERYWFAPTDLLLKDRFDSLAKAPHVKAPVLIFHGTADKVIASSHAEKLYSQLTHTLSNLTLYENINHTNVDFDLVLRDLEKLEDSLSQ